MVSEASSSVPNSQLHHRKETGTCVPDERERDTYSHEAEVFAMAMGPARSPHVVCCNTAISVALRQAFICKSRLYSIRHDRPLEIAARVVWGMAVSVASTKDLTPSSGYSMVRHSRSPE